MNFKTLNKYLVPAGIAALLLMSAPVASAHDIEADAGLNLKLGHAVRTEVRADAKAQRTSDGDPRWSKEEFAQWREDMKDKFSHFAVGVVTSIDGAILTLDPWGNKATTTVTTDSDTVFKTKSGTSTDISDVEVGSKVLVVGTTTATSSDGVSFTASIVKVIGEGFGHLRFWFWHHN